MSIEIKRVIRQESDDALELACIQAFEAAFEFIENLPRSREVSLAFTKLEESMLWIERSILINAVEVERAMNEKALRGRNND